jgi:ABC-type branched-subunit amino acid transport system permease subunit
MNAIRDDEERAEFFGYKRQTIQILVFAGTAGLAAVGGGLFAVTEGFVSPSLLGIALSTSAVLWVVLGGKGTFFGPLIALAVLQVLDRRMQDTFPQFWPIAIGGLLLITIVFLPKGLMSIPEVLRERKSQRTLRHSAPIRRELP